MNTFQLSRESSALAQHRFPGAPSPESSGSECRRPLPRRPREPSPSYTFISPSACSRPWVLRGSYPVEARQASGPGVPMHARHLIRFRRRFETVAASGRGPGDPLPQLPRRDQCLPAPGGALPGRLHEWTGRLCRGLPESGGSRTGATSSTMSSAAALEISERFEVLAASVERMERTVLDSWAAAGLRRVRRSRCAFLRTCREPAGALPAAGTSPASRTSAMTSGAPST